MKTIITTLFIAALGCGMTQAQGTTGELSGTVKDKQGEFLFTANIRIFSNGTFVGGAVTDINGIYRYKPLNPGSYDVEISYTGMTPQKINNVKVNAGQTVYADASLKVNTKIGPVIPVEAEWNPPAVSKEFSTITPIKANDIGHMPNRQSIVDIVTNVAPGVTPTHDGKDVYVRGSRRGATAYIIDGQRVLGGANIPSFGIANVTVITGGVPAEYGDLSGGVIVINSKDFTFGAYEKREMRKAYFDKSAKKETDAVIEE